MPETTRTDDRSLTYRVADLSHDGRGVLHTERGVVFVPGALPGETIRYQPLRKRRGQLNGKLIDIIEASPHRIQPRCEYFGVCGGCTLQHLDPDEQRRLKQETLFENLARIGGVAPQQRLPILWSDPWQYRRKARPGAKLVPKKGGMLVGFREQGSSYLTSLLHCDTLTPGLSQLLDPLHTLIGSLSCPDRIPQIEVAEGENAVAIVVRHLDPLLESDLEALERFARKQHIQLFLQSGGPDTVRPLFPVAPEPMTFSLRAFGLSFEFTPMDFVQVNASVNELMIGQALDWLEPKAGDHVLDLFCGLGNFTLPVASRGASVLGVEGDASLVSRAQGNARLNHLADKHQAQFEAMDLQRDGITRLAAAQFNKMLLDPPRSGAAQVVRELVPLIRPERLVYVSCNPATLARDAGILVNEHGYRFEAAGAIDMFPHTAHVESMAVFRLP